LGHLPLHNLVSLPGSLLEVALDVSTVPISDRVHGHVVHSAGSLSKIGT